MTSDIRLVWCVWCQCGRKTLTSDRQRRRRKFGCFLYFFKQPKRPWVSYFVECIFFSPFSLSCNKEMSLTLDEVQRPNIAKVTRRRRRWRTETKHQIIISRLSISEWIHYLLFLFKTHSLYIVILIGPDGNSTLKSRRHGHIVFSPVSFSHTWSVTSHCAKMNDEAAGKKKKNIKYHRLFE